MFHVTPSTNLPSILLHGLLPRIGQRSDELGEVVPRIYAFPTLGDCHDALSQWLGDWFNDEEESHGKPIELVILELDRNQIPTAFISSDVDWEVSIAEKIAPCSIKRVWSEEELGWVAHQHKRRAPEPHPPSKG